jgi:hypothetical protein
MFDAYMFTSHKYLMRKPNVSGKLYLETEARQPGEAEQPSRK